LPVLAPEPTPAKSPRPGPEHARAAAELAAGIEDENLRERVEKAIGFSLARPPSDRPV